MTDSTRKTWAARKARHVLNWSASERQAAPAIHLQALSALLFLHPKVFSTTLHWLWGICHPPVNRLLPVVLSR
jgi:hydrogenase/urease accessory protein HupE